MIIGGYSDLGKVEIIDPLDDISNFPMTKTFPEIQEFEDFSDGKIIAVTLAEDFILVCNARKSKCSTLNNKEWKPIGMLEYERNFASAVTINDSYVWITGGLDEVG